MAGSVANDPFQENYKRRWAARKEPLWVSFAAVKKDGPMNKCVVRMWLMRRLRVAFKESLGKRGFNYDGTRMEGCAEAKDIYGTVLFQPQEAAVRMKFVDLVGQADLAVEHIIRFDKPVVKVNRSQNFTPQRATGQKARETNADR